MNRVTSLLLCFILALLWMIVARLSLNIEHSDVVIDNSESDKNEASVMNVADANKVVSGAAVRVVGDADADKSGRAELQTELDFKPYWEKNDFRKQQEVIYNRKKHKERGEWASEFLYKVHGERFSGTSQCDTTTNEQKRNFDKAFEDYIKLHNDMTSGRRPGKFVHVGIIHKSSLQNNIKVVASVVLLGMITGRAALISWQRHLDPESQYWERRGWEDLFEMPPFNWTYDPAKYHGDRWGRYDVHGFGLEEYIEQEPLHRLLCSNIMTDNTRWWEVWWRYGFIGPLLWHSPYTHEHVAPLFAKDDMFGPLARRLFVPRQRLWQRISTFRRQTFGAHRVVGVVLQGGRAQLTNMLAAINADAAADREQLWANSAPSSATTSGGLLPPGTRLFVVSRDELAMRTVLRGYANDPQLVHYAHHNFSSVGDEGELIDAWLLSFCDIVYATPWHTNLLGAMFSRRPQITLIGNSNKRGHSDAQCQPCLSLSGIRKANCYNSSMMFPEPPYKCVREYPIF